MQHPAAKIRDLEKKVRILKRVLFGILGSGTLAGSCGLTYYLTSKCERSSFDSLKELVMEVLKSNRELIQSFSNTVTTLKDSVKSLNEKVEKLENELNSERKKNQEEFAQYATSVTKNMIEFINKFNELKDSLSKKNEEVKDKVEAIGRYISKLEIMSRANLDVKEWVKHGKKLEKFLTDMDKAFNSSNSQIADWFLNNFETFKESFKEHQNEKNKE